MDGSPFLLYKDNKHSSEWLLLYKDKNGSLPSLSRPLFLKSIIFLSGVEVLPNF